MNVLAVLASSIEDEPRLIQSFIAGYESEGGEWTGTIDYQEDVPIMNDADLVDSLLASDNSLFLRNSWALSDYDLQRLYVNSQGQKMLVACGGSNKYQHFEYAIAQFREVIACGAGKLDENTTCYQVEFTDIDPYAERDITGMFQATGTRTAIASLTGDDFITPYNFLYWVYGVSGFSNNPEGAFTEQDISHGGDRARVDIAWILGSGSYAGGGTLECHFQSYSHAYIAGKLAYIKDTLGCTWWEARYRARITASNNGVFDYYSGYGKINTANAIAYQGSITPDPYLTIGTPTTPLRIASITRNNSRTLIMNFEFDKVDNASQYELLRNGNVIDTVYISLSDELNPDGGRNFSNVTLELDNDSLSETSFQYRGCLGEQRSSLSEALMISNIKFLNLITDDDINS